MKSRHFTWRLVAFSLAILLLCAVVTLLSVAVRIRRQSLVNEARPADVILVMGAAEYRGVPSPVLKARLDHALELYRLKLAPFILTTGGAGGDPVFTEGEVGRAYLTRQGVPSESILVEPVGSSTVESLANAAEIMRLRDFRSCVVVSDGYHIYRVKRVLQARGIKVYGSPRPEKPRRESSEWELYFRQATAYLLWRVGIAI